MDIRYCLLKDKTISNSDFTLFKKQVSVFLKDIENKYNVKYKRTCLKCAHIHVILASKELTNSLFKQANETIDFSWTDQSCDIIMFCFDNWKYLYLDHTSETNKLYQKYVILHEFLHAFPFYLDHIYSSSCNENGKYNVMYQQTRNASVKNKIPKQICIKKEIELPDIEINLKNEIKDYNKRKAEIQQKKKSLFKKIQSQKIN